MKKVLLFVAVLIVSAISVNAQNKTTFSLAGNIGVGTTKYYKLVAGGDLQVDIPATTGLKITASAGYENFSYKAPVTNGTVSGHSSFIPLLAGAKFNLGGKAYGHAQLGYAISTLEGGTGRVRSASAPRPPGVLSARWPPSRGCRRTLRG